MTTRADPAETTAAAPAGEAAWWRRAVVYEIYIRSFGDANGDGVGDIAGIRARLPYLRDLEVDAFWVTPWYPSPMADGGYDVADYRDVDPMFGSLAEAGELIADAHRHGLRVILDIVPNHTSAKHAWFLEALASGRGSAARARYIFRDGRGSGGGEPPNNWRSVFGGPAWTRVAEPDGSAGQWYLHLFAPQQPDLNWESAEVRAEFESILGFWLDRGVDGFRVDVANALVKDPQLGDLPATSLAGATSGFDLDPHPHWDREAVHDVYRGWRRVVEARGGGLALVGEIGAPPERLARYLRPDELHGAFNFDFMRRPWDAAELRASIDATLATHRPVGAAPTWVLSNHDEARHATRYGRPFTGLTWGRPDVARQRSDRAVGLRRARAAILLLLALPGSVYLYQGEELGLWEVDDLPDEVLADPVWERSGHADRGRDGCRVPLPWSADGAPFGFGPPGSIPWLPQPAGWGMVSVEAETGDPTSMLELYRAALRLRRSHPGLAAESIAWIESPAGTLVFARDDGLTCAVNLADRPYRVPAGLAPLLASAEVVDGLLPPDAAVWLVAAGDAAGVGGDRP